RHRRVMPRNRGTRIPEPFMAWYNSFDRRCGLASTFGVESTSLPRNPRSNALRNNRPPEEIVFTAPFII
ncbi:hypothetical protein, partial [Paraburkholderia sp. J41]|uniref:hypothetical protein n=1 Tax=Paraburkholderia sp. J41 TaxID=2805433 RepID=UPI002AC359F2